MADNKEILINTQQKDFMVEIARGITVLEESGLNISKMSLIIELNEAEFFGAHKQIMTKVIAKVETPKNMFKMNFSGVEVIFKKI